MIALNFASVTAGVWHTCGVTTNGDAYCWGYNLHGQLGDGSIGSPTTRTTPVRVARRVRFRSLNSGVEDPAAHTCGVTMRGAAYCWGHNQMGRLGDGSTDPRPVPASVHGGLTFASVSAGFRHTCGVTASGEAYCWGNNFLGALGDSSESNTTEPTLVAGGISIQSISAGASFTCGLAVSGDAYCWGMNRVGQLGTGSEDQEAHPTPEHVARGLAFQAVSAGVMHACGVTTDGAAYCWGRNSDGRLGTGVTVASAVPVPVFGGITFQSISAGGHTCGVSTRGEAYCWGANDYGQLGDGSGGRADDFRPVPVRAAGSLTFESVSVGRDHTCGITTGDIVHCWGSNERGMLGRATTTTCSGRPCSKRPIRVSGQR